MKLFHNLLLTIGLGLFAASPVFAQETNPHQHAQHEGHHKDDASAKEKKSCGGHDSSKHADGKKEHSCNKGCSKDGKKACKGHEQSAHGDFQHHSGFDGKEGHACNKDCNKDCKKACDKHKKG